MNRFEATWLGQLRRRGDRVHNGRVLVACSGGGDSVALLLFLHAARKSLGLDLVVAHADHGLRPDSGEDAAFVQRLCRCLDLDLAEVCLRVREHAAREGLGLETAARNLRWAWLRAEAGSCSAAWIATGHTLDDHTETVLLRLARGGGLGALTPLPALQGGRWSPLIEARRQDLRDYLQRRGVPWREDASNGEDFTPRNRLRKLLEPLRAEAPALDAHLWETHQQARELEEWRDGAVRSWSPERWSTADGALRLAGAWTELELRWVLEAAMPALGVAVEAKQLRDLAAWTSLRLARRNRRSAEWGGWHLDPLKEAWDLNPPGSL
jgi:tRNA(Ile)-lysidine synthase